MASFTRGHLHNVWPESNCIGNYSPSRSEWTYSLWALPFRSISLMLHYLLVSWHFSCFWSITSWSCHPWERIRGGRCLVNTITSPGPEKNLLGTGEGKKLAKCNWFLKIPLLFSKRVFFLSRSWEHTRHLAADFCKAESQERGRLTHSLFHCMCETFRENVEAEDPQDLMMLFIAIKSVLKKETLLVLCFHLWPLQVKKIKIKKQHEGC